MTLTKREQDEWLSILLLLLEEVVEKNKFEMEEFSGMMESSSRFRRFVIQ